MPARPTLNSGQAFGACRRHKIVFVIGPSYACISRVFVSNIERLMINSAIHTKLPVKRKKTTGKVVQIVLLTHNSTIFLTKKYCTHLAKGILI